METKWISISGHRSLGYAGKGVYKCKCGEEFKTSGEDPLPAFSPISYQWVKDQWKAHVREEAKQQS